MSYICNGTIRDDLNHLRIENLKEIWKYFRCHDSSILNINNQTDHIHVDYSKLNNLHYEKIYKQFVKIFHIFLKYPESELCFYIDQHTMLITRQQNKFYVYINKTLSNIHIIEFYIKLNQ